MSAPLKAIDGNADLPELMTVIAGEMSDLAQGAGEDETARARAQIKAGMLMGLIFLNPLLGAAIGAAAGGVIGKFEDFGLNDKVMKDLAQSFKPGTSALFVLVRRATTDKVLEGLKDFTGKGKVFQSNLNKDDEQALQQALDAA